MKTFTQFLRPKLLLSVLLTTVLMAFAFSSTLYAQSPINSSTKFTVDFDGTLTQYAPGTQVKLYASPIQDGEYFNSFAYDANIITNPGFYYNNSNGFTMTFQMPCCDVEVSAMYGGEWTVNYDGNLMQTGSATSSTVTGYSYIEHAMLSEDQSGYNVSLMPGEAVVTLYPNSPTVSVSINGSLKTYSAGQPIVITEPYQDTNTGYIVSGYDVDGSFVEGESYIYTSLATGALYKHTVLPGVDTDAIITTVKEQGCVVSLKDNLGNSFGYTIVKMGETAKFALPTEHGGYTLHDITGTDYDGNNVDVNRVAQTDGHTILSVTGATPRIDITFAWQEVTHADPIEPTQTPQTALSRTVLSPVINSTGVIEVYDPADISAPKARIDADDIQQNRNDILELQNMLSNTDHSLDGSSSEAVYFFHNPTITHTDGTTEILEGWFMQKGSEIPKANDSWLQVG